jgi:general secretion pathway protein G
MMARSRIAQSFEGDRRGEAGFTLVEMLVVLAIIGMITALVGPQVMNYLGRAKVDTARVEVQNLGTALDLFRLDVGRYPTEQEGLHGLVTKPSGLDRWNGPYLRKQGNPIDPWGRAYAYRVPGSHGAYDLYSQGPDGTSDGTDAQGVKSW